ncbi:MAG: hypothetical protein MRZ79_04085 [Bacteroidia bacterium]|nr:hypothetical protein [Bacteroidia bacterium]
MKKKLRIFLFPILLLAAWITFDLTVPVKRDISSINGKEIGEMEAKMWEAYYSKKKVDLLFNTAKIMRKQFKIPYWRSYLAAYYAAEAAFIFKNGTNREEYQLAYTSLEKYFQLINNISIQQFDVAEATQLELEWWIIRRYRDEHPPIEWEKWLARVASTVHGLPAKAFEEYAHLRVEAMLYRDRKGRSMTGEDWEYIRKLLHRAWGSLEQTISEPKTMAES